MKEGGEPSLESYEKCLNLSRLFPAPELKFQCYENNPQIKGQI